MYKYCLLFSANEITKTQLFFAFQLNLLKCNDLNMNYVRYMLFKY